MSSTRTKKGKASPQTLRALRKACPLMRQILDQRGPPRWAIRNGGFPGLARIIIEQQLSVASANTILRRVHAITQDLHPEHLARARDEDLRAAGLSRPKIRYLRTLADDLAADRFSFAALANLDDQEAAVRLEALLGVGRWTAAVYLLFCADRKDLWPRSDVALLAAQGFVGGPYGKNDMKAFDAHAEATYAPYRGVAAHIFWSEIAARRGYAPL